ncbi:MULTISPECIES: DNA glycosylase AlkZ-like family protein [unclassified Streptomyces]|uniref:winged helix-turn-helix domain-containing protein n=1 Tax=unclassified Streptomyces TaxID=2593676 RepID=UPI003316C1EA
MSDIELSIEHARRMAVSCQHLEGPAPRRGDERLREVLSTLRCLQLDPIDAVAQSHLLVLWSRLGSFDRRRLDTLLWKERWLFEYWAHAASIVLTEDYPLHQALMRGHLTGEQPAHARRAAEWCEANGTLRDAVLARLRTDGPQPTDGFDAEAAVPWDTGGWSAGRNVDRMLDLLWTRGEIMVAGRNGRRRLWDLAERCLPEWTGHEPLPEREVVSRAAEHSLRALGVGRRRDIEQHFVRSRYPGLADLLPDLVARGRFVPVTLQDAPERERWYVHADRLPLLERIQNGRWTARTTLLSPFDNLICHRERTQRLWEFDFTSEIYVPKARRRYGYYVMPILHGERLIGRVAPRYDRRQETLTIEGVYAEPTASRAKTVARAVGRSLTGLASFVGARRIAVDGPVPPAWQDALLPVLLGSR